MTDKEINSLVIKLEREQKIADGNLKNSEWKLDQEAKQYFEAKNKVEAAKVIGVKANQDFKRHQQLTPVESSTGRSTDSRASMHSKTSKSRNGF
ncbi:Oidioi.mRNA.OKI2018_I69.chr1.g2532.t2.cds [Oikopleura dioica]|nr:Oidioi.mRNA.OKI2018_I69.chr1.g2532.t2.cds [Oikopleura dioica]